MGPSLFRGGRVWPSERSGRGGEKAALNVIKMQLGGGAYILGPYTTAT
ncbi:hypothetical protein BCEP4_610028 [Burkholderia cepacia]|nr:hypothetical protein BCEP4_610028 [Burkholderia cepacia]